jgi:hypothetical protein
LIGVPKNQAIIAGMVAAMTESELAGIEMKNFPNVLPCVNRDSATRRARRLAVEFDVGEL